MHKATGLYYTPVGKQSWTIKGRQYTSSKRMISSFLQRVTVESGFEEAILQSLRRDNMSIRTFNEKSSVYQVVVL